MAAFSPVPEPEAPTTDPQNSAAAMLAGTIPPPPPMGSMPEESTNKSGWIKWLLITIGIIVVVGGALYFVGSQYLSQQQPTVDSDDILEDPFAQTEATLLETPSPEDDSFNTTDSLLP
jgi:hypothetical protein